MIPKKASAFFKKIDFFSKKVPHRAKYAPKLLLLMRLGLVLVRILRYNSKKEFNGVVLALQGLLSTQMVVQYALRALVMLVAIPFHESAHALVSHLLGDDTAKNAGRLSLNPLRHFDPMGALCMVVAGVGWAKPVGIDPRRYKNPKVGMAISAAAGPASNLLLAWVSYAALKFTVYSGLSTGVAGGYLVLFLRLMTLMNITLGVFNLIPVPPFDGSRIALLFLPERLYFQAMRYERYIMMGVLALVFLGALNLPLNAVTDVFIRLIDRLTSFVDLAYGIPRY